MNYWSLKKRLDQATHCMEAIEIEAISAFGGHTVIGRIQKWQCTVHDRDIPRWCPILEWVVRITLFINLSLHTYRISYSSLMSWCICSTSSFSPLWLSWKLLHVYACMHVPFRQNCILVGPANMAAADISGFTFETIVYSMQSLFEISVWYVCHSGRTAYVQTLIYFV